VGALRKGFEAWWWDFGTGKWSWGDLVRGLFREKRRKTHHCWALINLTLGANCLRQQVAPQGCRFMSRPILYFQVVRAARAGIDGQKNHNDQQSARQILPSKFRTQPIPGY
jgi:hypothetical protein